MARPRKTLTDEQKTQVEALASVLSAEQIADYFGMSRASFYNIMDREPEIYRRYKKGRSETIRKVGNSLIQQALNGDKTAQMFYLKTQAGWRETQNIDHTSSDESMSKTNIDATKLSTETLKELKNINADSESDKQ